MRKSKTQLVVDRILRALDGFDEEKQRKILGIVGDYLGDDLADDDEDEETDDMDLSPEERREREGED